MKKKISNEEKILKSVVNRLDNIEGKVDNVRDKVRDIQYDTEQTNKWITNSVLVVMVIGAIFLLGCLLVAVGNNIQENEVEEMQLHTDYCSSLGYAGFVSDYDREGGYAHSPRREGWCFNDDHKPHFKVMKNDVDLWKAIREVQLE